MLSFFTEELPRYDRAVTHVWQNDRGYLFNAIRAKLTAYRKKDGNIYNKDLPGASNEGLLVEQDGNNVTVSHLILHFFFKPHLGNPIYCPRNSRTKVGDPFLVHLTMLT